MKIKLLPTPKTCFGFLMDQTHKTEEYKSLLQVTDTLQSVSNLCHASCSCHHPLRHAGAGATGTAAGRGTAQNAEVAFRSVLSTCPSRTVAHRLLCRTQSPAELGAPLSPGPAPTQCRGAAAAQAQAIRPSEPQGRRGFPTAFLRPWGERSRPGCAATGGSLGQGARPSGLAAPGLRGGPRYCEWPRLRSRCSVRSSAAAAGRVPGPPSRTAAAAPGRGAGRERRCGCAVSGGGLHCRRLPRGGGGQRRREKGRASHCLSAAAHWLVMSNLLDRLKGEQTLCFSGGKLCGSRKQSSWVLALLCRASKKANPGSDRIYKYLGEK